MPTWKRIVARIKRWVPLRRSGEPFPGSPAYWERRYQVGGTSGSGSYGRLAEFKAEVLNKFVAQHQIRSVIEFGCGDGNQLSIAHYPAYVGVDVSETSIRLCRERFANDSSKQFFLAGTVPEPHRRADLALSLDVIYHLVEDPIYNDYMQTLFDAGLRYVIVYASNCERSHGGVHVRHREFTAWVTAHRPDWKLFEVIPNRYPAKPGEETDNTSFADFYLFERQ